MTLCEMVFKRWAKPTGRNLFEFVSNETIRKVYPLYSIIFSSLVFVPFFFGISLTTVINADEVPVYANVRNGGAAVNAGMNVGSNAGAGLNPFQAIYPPIAKIVGEGETEQTADEQCQSIFYGSGIYVAEVGEFGIVLTNWHVVSEAKGCLLVRFSQFETPGAVIMADAVWDIAAIVIYRPPFLPFPISLEVPQVGDELWVAGFGQYPDLNGYQISSGPVLGYGRPKEESGDENEGKTSSDPNVKRKRGPDVKATLPCETIQIGTGIRYGDSGGPIINRYGELAGILWGSDGLLTMGTFCLRLQAFLTQAQFQLMNYSITAPEFFARASRNEIPLKKISMPSVPAQTALRSSGIYPISSRPVYGVSTNESRRIKNLPAFYKPIAVTDIEGAKTSFPSKEFRKIQKDYQNAHRDGFLLPPYPAVPSPTLIAQQKAIGRNHPEVYADGRFAAKSVGNGGNQTAEVRPTAATDVALSPSGKKGGDGHNNRNSPLFQNASLEKESAAKPGVSPEMTTVHNAAQEGDENGNVESAEEETSEGGEKGGWLKKIPGFPNISLSNLQSIVAMIIVLFLFVNALRLLVIASERSGRTKK